MEQANILCIDTPLGTIRLTETDGALTRLEFDSPPIDGQTSSSVLLQAAEQLKLYFEGELSQFNLPLNPAGSAYQKSVWAVVASIPFGKVETYGNISGKTSITGHARAVGRANALNPIPIIIPCHRVVGANQSLTGYSGGISRKIWLLKHENAYLL